MSTAATIEPVSLREYTHQPTNEATRSTVTQSERSAASEPKETSVSSAECLALVPLFWPSSSNKFFCEMPPRFQGATRWTT